MSLERWWLGWALLLTATLGAVWPVQAARQIDDCVTDGPLGAQEGAAAQWLYLGRGGLDRDVPFTVVAWDPLTGALHNTGVSYRLNAALHPQRAVLASEDEVDGVHGLYEVPLDGSDPRLLYAFAGGENPHFNTPLRWVSDITVGLVLNNWLGPVMLIDTVTGTTQTFQVPFPPTRHTVVLQPPLYNADFTRVVYYESLSMSEHGPLVWDVQTGTRLLKRALDGVWLSMFLTWVDGQDALGFFQDGEASWQQADVALDVLAPWIAATDPTPPATNMLILPNVHAASGRVAALQVASGGRREDNRPLLQLLLWQDGVPTLTCVTSQGNTIRINAKTTTIDLNYGVWDATGTRLAFSTYGEVAGRFDYGVLVLDATTDRAVRALSLVPGVPFEVLGRAAARRTVAVPRPVVQVLWLRPARNYGMVIVSSVSPAGARCVLTK